MCRPNVSSHLPPEIVWIVIKYLLVDLSTTARHESEDFTSYIPLNILTLNRCLHELVLTTAYRTVTLTSLDLLHRFSNVVNNSPHLACLVHNLWIGTPHLGSFSVGWMSSVITVGYILSKIPMIKRLALPAPLLPLEFTKFGDKIEHITIRGGPISALPCKVKTVYIHGSILRPDVQLFKKETLMRIVCDLKRPYKPGAIGYVVQELLGDGTKESGLQLEFVVIPAISSWIKRELSQISADSLLRGVLTVRVRHRGGGDRGSFRAYTHCEEWADMMRAS